MCSWLSSSSPHRFPRDALEVHPPGLGAPRLLTPPTRPAQPGRRVHMALRDFVPPFLLARRPNLLTPAFRAAKRHIDVIPTRDVLGRAVAVVGGERGLIDA